jgi:hypothetical protein
MGGVVSKKRADSAAAAAEPPALERLFTKVFRVERSVATPLSYLT